MFYIILSILSGSSIFILFKIVDQLKLKIFPIILLNYIGASLLGIVFTYQEFSFHQIIHKNWLLLSVILGILLVLTFYLIGLSTKKTGIIITTISTKMSVIMPISFSIFYFHEDIYFTKILGIIIALVAIILSTVKRSEQKSQNPIWIFPIILLIAAGLIDTLLKLGQTAYIQTNEHLIFSMILFIIATLVAFISFLIFQFNFKEFFQIKTLLFGGILGFINFASIVFILKALEYSKIDSSVVFLLVNTGVIILSVFSAFLIFKEKIESWNWLGFLLSIIALIFLS